MKKILSICLVALLCMSNLISVHASYNEFYEQVSDLIISTFSSNEFLVQNIQVSNEVPTNATNESEKLYLLSNNMHIIGLLRYNESNQFANITDLREKNISKNKVDSYYFIEIIGDELIIKSENHNYYLLDDKYEGVAKNNYKNYVCLKEIYSIPLINSRAGAAGSIDLPAVKQDTSYDCWAACVVSVAKYKGKSTYTPAKTAQKSAVGDAYVGATIYQTRDCLKSVYGISSTAVTQGPSIMEIVNLIGDNRNPIITGFSTSGTSGHMVVIKGYNTGSQYATVFYMDPATKTFKSSSVQTDRKISFVVGNKTYTSSCYLRL